MGRFSIKNLIPLKGDSAGEVIRKILVIIFAVVFLVSVGHIISYYHEINANKNLNQKLQQQHKAASSTVPSSRASQSNGILPELVSSYNINKETVGWITIPGTNIDYPVVQDKSDTKNEKYLTTDFTGKKERHGSIFLDFRFNIKPLSQDLIIYGHNMKDGQMFGELEKYCKARGNDYVGFYNSSPIIEFDTLYERYKWKIFAVFVTTGNPDHEGSIDYINPKLGSDSEFNAFIKEIRRRSFINTKVDVQPGDNLLTLSTCNYDYPRTDNEWARLVVMARKVRDGESTSVEPAEANKNVVYPSIWYKKNK
ncbi:hypothetical protein CCDG5_1783 [[Clostridium] cellulosi]|uniref:Sortase B n=1 Tax=[Clostridium] cellulosi TaxID=29343 RepID=A0A078KMF8_9FIRM|nr:hypothetical protein CCDG5_1783 [[Clostridium] cellulosi]